MGGEGSPWEEISKRGRDGMSFVRRVPMSCESAKGMKPKGITECESDPQRDHLESLRDLAALLALEMEVRGVR